MNQNLPSASPEHGLGPLGGDDFQQQWSRHQPEEASVDWRRYLAAIFRYKWLVLAATVVGTGAGVFLNRLTPARFAAQATLWVQASSSDGSGPLRSSELLQAQSWVDLLKSFVVLDNVVRGLQLYVSRSPADSTVFTGFGLAERFVPGEYELRVSPSGAEYSLVSGGATVEAGSVGDSIGRPVGFAWQPPAEAFTGGQSVGFSVLTPRDAAVRLRDDLDVSIDRQANFIRLGLSGVNPGLIARALNATVDRFVDVAAELKRDKLTERRRILQEQLQYAWDNLQQAEMELEDFRVRTITLPSDRVTPLAPGLEVTRDPVFTSFFTMQVDLDQLRRDREAIERILRAAPDSGLSTDGLLVIGAVGQSAELSQALAEYTTRLSELRTLRLNYTDDHPEVQRVQAGIDDLRERAIPTVARALIADLRVRESELKGRIESASHDLQEVPARSIEEGRLRRAVTIAEQLYTNLQNRFEEARLEEASTIPDVSVLDRAVVPQRPMRDEAMRMVVMGLVGGMGLGLVLAILLDRLDRRLRYPGQVRDELGLSILGAVPHIRNRKGGLRGNEAAPVVEALRGVRLALAHAHGAAGPLLVTVSSPGAGDGKSFLAANLALAYADAGHRTLLIDGDLRRGEQHRLLGAKRKPGLTDVLSGTVSEDDAIQATTHRPLEFIGGGTRMAQAPELLESPAMASLIIRLRSRFGVIIVDSPPLSVGVDPFVLATATGNLLMVLRTGVTDRELAGAKLDVLDRLPIRVLGAVLNDVRPNGEYRYYGYEYYSRGYEIREETNGARGGARVLPGVKTGSG